MGQLISRFKSSVPYLGYWDLLPKEIQDHVTSFLTDDEKIDVLKTFPWLANEITSVTFDRKDCDVESILSRYPNIKHVWIRMELLNIIHIIAQINPNIETINCFYWRYKIKESVDNYSQRAAELYIVTALRFYGSSFNGSKLRSALYWKLNDHKYQNLNLNRAIDGDDIGCLIRIGADLTPVTELQTGDQKTTLYGQALLDAVKQCPRIRRLQIWIIDVFNYEHIFNIPTIECLVINSRRPKPEAVKSMVTSLLNCTNPNLKHVEFAAPGRSVKIRNNVLIVSGFLQVIPIVGLIITFRRISVVILELCFNQTEISVKVKRDIDAFNEANRGQRLITLVVKYFVQTYQ